MEKKIFELLNLPEDIKLTKLILYSYNLHQNVSNAPLRKFSNEELNLLINFYLIIYLKFEFFIFSIYYLIFLISQIVLFFLHIPMTPASVFLLQLKDASAIM